MSDETVMGIVRYMQKRADELAAHCGDKPGFALPSEERYFRNAGASTALHNLANEVGHLFASRLEGGEQAEEQPKRPRCKGSCGDAECKEAEAKWQGEQPTPPVECEHRKALEIQRKAWAGVVRIELDGPLVDFAEAQIRRIDAALSAPCHQPTTCPTCAESKQEVETLVEALKYAASGYESSIRNQGADDEDVRQDDTLRRLGELIAQHTKEPTR